MDKLLQLVNQYKDKLGHENHQVALFRGISGKEYTFLFSGGHDYYKHLSLSDLLFSTEFLDIIERKSLMAKKRVYKEYDYNSEKFKKIIILDNLNDSNSYHKINLALLETDIERISYIEDSTL